MTDTLSAHSSMTITKNIDALKTEIAGHIAADAVIQGVYWLSDDSNAAGGKGCFIGCLAHSDNPTIIQDLFGIPLYVTRIAESIFERLPEAEARQFFADFPDAVGIDGKDLSRVHWQFLASELRSLPPQEPDIQAVIDPVITGMDLLAAGQEWPRADAQTAWAAADAAWAAWGARDAARTAGRAAADAAEAAGAAAWAASWAAEAAAWGAAWDAAARRQRDLLLRLITEAPVAPIAGATGPTAASGRGVPQHYIEQANV